MLKKTLRQVGLWNLDLGFARQTARAGMTRLGVQGLESSAADFRGSIPTNSFYGLYPGPWAEQKSRSPLGLHNLRHGSVTIQNRGFCFLHPPGVWVSGCQEVDAVDGSRWRIQDRRGVSTS